MIKKSLRSCFTQKSTFPERQKSIYGGEYKYIKMRCRTKSGRSVQNLQLIQEIERRDRKVQFHRGNCARISISADFSAHRKTKRGQILLHIAYLHTWHQEPSTLFFAGNWHLNCSWKLKDEKQREIFTASLNKRLEGVIKKFFATEKRQLKIISNKVKTRPFFFVSLFFFCHENFYLWPIYFNINI